MIVFRLEAAVDIICLGDFNFPKVDCGICPTLSQPALLFNFVSSLFLDQVVSNLTRGSNMLDLIFASSDIIQEILIKGTTISDHDLLDQS